MSHAGMQAIMPYLDSIIDCIEYVLTVFYNHCSILWLIASLIASSMTCLCFIIIEVTVYVGWSYCMSMMCDCPAVRQGALLTFIYTHSCDLWGICSVFALPHVESIPPCTITLPIFERCVFIF